MTRNDKTEPARVPLWQWFVLYLLVVALPSWMVADYFRALFAEQAETRSQMAAAKLSVDAAAAAHFFRSSFLLESLLTRSAWPEARWPQFVEALERRYPGAFRWILYDRSQQIIPIVPTARLPGGPGLWHRVVSSYAIASMSFYRLLDARLGTDPLLGEVQRALGPGFRFENLLSTSRGVLYGPWEGEPAVMAWWQDGRDAADNIVDRGRLRGFFAVMRPGRLPPLLPMRLIVRGHAAGMRRSTSSLVAIDPADPRRFYTHPTVPREPALGERLWTAHRHRTADVFRVDHWLATAVPIREAMAGRVFLLHDLAPGERQYQWQYNILMVILFAVQAIGVLLLLSCWRRGGLELGLRWRIMSALSLAMLLPLGGLYQLGERMVAREYQVRREQLAAGLSRDLALVMPRYRDFSSRYGAALLASLTRAVAGPLSEREISTRLQRFVSRPAHQVSDFYLSDARGRLARSGREQSDRRFKTIAQIMLSGVLRDNGGPTESSAFNESMLETVAEVAEKDRRMDQSLLRVNEWGLHMFMRDSRYIIALLPRVDGTMRSLLVPVNPALVKVRFANREFVRGLTPELQAVGLSRANFTSDQWGHIPAVPAFWQNGEIRQALEDRRTQRAGEFTLNNGRFLYQTGARTALFPYIFVGVAPLDPVAAEVNRHAWAFRGAALFVTGLVGVLGWLLAAGLLAPIRRLEVAVRQVAAGNLDVEVAVVGRDEIGRLAENFNDMFRGLRERERMQAYVSPAVLEAVRDDATAAGQQARTCEATVFVADIRSFTTLSEKHGPQAMFAMLNEYMTGVEALLREHGGRIDKFIGDAVLAVFLDPGRAGALEAVRAAWAVTRFVAEFSTRRQRAGLFGVGVGVGITTGRVLVGTVGSATRKDLAVIGDEVERAAQLEAASKQGRHSRIILSPATHDLVKDVTRCISLAPSHARDADLVAFEVVEAPSA